MKPFFEHIETSEGSSIKVKTYAQQLIDVPMHFHPEHEIVYVQKGNGSLFLADVEEDFTSGELFFIRGSIPHLFEDAAVHTGKKQLSKVTVIQYNKSLFEGMYQLPEFNGVSRLETMIGYGVKLRASTSMARLVNAMEQQDGLLQFNTLISLLHEIIHDKNHQYLGTIGTVSSTNHIAYLRLQKMHSFLSGYFYKNITVEEVAVLLHLTKTGFCRFLKRETGKTFSEHLNYYRIQHACALLRQSSDSVMQICYGCGFNNAAYFFRQFRKQKGVAPLEYRKAHNEPQFSGRVSK